MRSEDKAVAVHHYSNLKFEEQVVLLLRSEGAMMSRYGGQMLEGRLLHR